MRWRLVDKSGATIPTSGTYSQWKPQLAIEAGSQCVYCCIPESKFGGLRNFHVEHYRPKSIFPTLTNDYGNLFFACGVCNIFKSDDWPSEHQVGRYDVPAYPDPSKVNYSDFLSVNPRTGMAFSTSFAGNYIIQRLHLNRPQMVGLRAMSALFARMDQAHAEIASLIESDAVPAEDIRDVMALLSDLLKMARKYSEARPYGADQLKAAV